jgi:hypothetical protein
MFKEFGDVFGKVMMEHLATIKESKTSIKTPDEFTGEDPAALKAFVAQCEMLFRSRPQSYDNDEAKITFMTSYFRKTAQAWWQPYLLNPSIPPPNFTVDYLDFLDELHAQFGEIDPEGEAEEKLDNLKMAESHHVAKYSIEFTSLSANTRYDEFALRRRFYKGLPNRIKDEIVKLQVQPESFSELRAAALRLDSYYWRREHEKRQESSKSYSTPPRRLEQNPPRRFQKSAPSSKKPIYVPRQSMTPKPPPSPIPSSLIGPDGHLLPAERDRRYKEGLCLICGNKGHSVKNCPSRKTPIYAKGRAKGRNVEAKGRFVEVEKSDDEAEEKSQSRSSSRSSDYDSKNQE